MGEVLGVEWLDDDGSPADSHDAVMSSQAKVAGQLLPFFVRRIVEERHRVFEAGADDVSVGRNFLKFGEWRMAGEANDRPTVDDLRCCFVDSTTLAIFFALFRHQRFECARYASVAATLAWRFVVLALETAALGMGLSAGSTLHILAGIQDRRCGLAVVPIVTDTHTSCIFGRPSNAWHLEVLALYARKMDVTIVEIGAVTVFSLAFNAAGFLCRRSDHLAFLIILKA